VEGVWLSEGVGLGGVMASATGDLEEGEVLGKRGGGSSAVSVFSFSFLRANILT